VGMFFSIFRWSYINFVLIIVIIFLKGLFKVLLYVRVAHGKWRNINKFWVKFSFRYSLIRKVHIFFLFSLFFFIRNFL
jgi:hypothetical protein